MKLEELLSRIQEARAPVQPPIAPGCTRLYRGDAKNIAKFDIGLTSFYNLFGQGIYLTDNIRVSRDYVSKGNQDDVMFRMGGARTKDDVLQTWLRRQAAKFDAEGNDRSGEMQYWTNAVPFADGTDWAIRSPKTADEYARRIEYARQKWQKLSQDYEIRVKLDGTAVMQRKSVQSAGRVTMFDIPTKYLSATLIADEEISDDVLSIVLWVLNRYGDRGTARDIQSFVDTEQGEDGFSPTFRAIYTRLDIDSPIRSDDAAGNDFRNSLQDLGFNGIQYRGGLSMGGGFKHIAYVLWDDKMVNSHRVN